MSLFAFTIEQAAKLSGLSKSQIRYWADTDFFQPSLRSEKGRPYGRIYSFRDVVGLRTLSQLRTHHQVPLQQLRRVSEWLEAHYDAPWAELRFYVGGQRVYFRDPRVGTTQSGSVPPQTVMKIELKEVAAATEAEAKHLQNRDSQEFGQIDQHRYVSHNAPVIRGTRIRTEAIWSFHEAGYSTDDILRQYPRLVADDVAAAIAFESERRRPLVS